MCEDGPGTRELRLGKPLLVTVLNTSFQIERSRFRVLERRRLLFERIKAQDARAFEKRSLTSPQD